jgi:hypothetical protein
MRWVLHLMVPDGMPMGSWGQLEPRNLYIRGTTIRSFLSTPPTMSTKATTYHIESASPAIADDMAGGDNKSNGIMHNEETAMDFVKFEEQGFETIHGARSKWEDLDTKSTFRLFWKGILVCFLAAFSSFTDGYQVSGE